MEQIYTGMLGRADHLNVLSIAHGLFLLPSAIFELDGYLFDLYLKHNYC